MLADEESLQELYEKISKSIHDLPLSVIQTNKEVEDDLYLSGTAELILNSLRADEIIPENELPILYAGFSPCFRREAGAAGKDTRGLTRVHQFMKTEQFVICKNDVNESEKWHQKLLQISEEVLQDLELPYQDTSCFLTNFTH